MGQPAYRKIHDELGELGETCGRNRVGRLMQAERLRLQTGYQRRPGFYGGKSTVALVEAGEPLLNRLFKRYWPISKLLMRGDQSTRWNGFAWRQTTFIKTSSTTNYTGQARLGGQSTDRWIGSDSMPVSKPP